MDLQRFAEFWQRYNVDEISLILQTTPDTVRHYATLARKRGFNLPSKRQPAIEIKLFRTVIALLQKAPQTIPQRKALRDRLLFITAWQLSSSVDEVAVATGKTSMGCRTLARTYRDLGIPLKKFPKGAKLKEKPPLPPKPPRQKKPKPVYYCGCGREKSATAKQCRECKMEKHRAARAAIQASVGALRDQGWKYTKIAVYLGLKVQKVRRILKGR